MSVFENVVKHKLVSNNWRPFMKQSDDRSIAFEHRAQLEKLIANYDSEGNSPVKVGEEPFRWSAIQALAESILDSVYDLNVAMCLLRAQIIQGGLNGLREGLLRVAELVRKSPDELYPMGDEDDESPAQTHALVLGWLGGEGFLSLVKAIHIDAAHPLRIGDLLQSVKGLAAIPEPSKSTACKLLNDSYVLLLEIREKISSSGAKWDRDPIVAIELISDCRKLLSGASSGSLMNMSSVESNAGQDVLDRAQGDAQRLVDRADVRATLDRLDRYYSEIEPAHPAPILIGRLKKMVDASFEEIMKELYVDAPLLISRISNPVGHI